MGIGDIPILAKELAMNTVRDNTTRLGLGIGRLSYGDLKAFHAAFKAADAGLDGKVCRGTGSGDDGEAGKKCKADNTAGKGGLDKVYGEKVDKIDAEIGYNIAKSISKLSKEEKAFHTTFKAADADLDKKVCKNGSDNEAEGKKCKAGSTGTNGGLDKVYAGENGVVLVGKVSNGYGKG